MKYTLFPKQEEFIKALFSGRYESATFGGAVGGGKTFTIILYAIIVAQVFPKSRGVICRKDLERIRKNFLPKFLDIIDDSFTAQYPTASNSWTWKHKNGSEVMLFAENIDKDPNLLRFSGLEYDWIAFEEMDISHKTYRKAFERLGRWKMDERKRSLIKGEAIPPRVVIGTTNPQQNWVKTKIYDRRHEQYWIRKNLYLPSKVYDNPHVDEGYIERLKSQYTPLEFQMYVEGDFNINLNEHPFFYSYSFSKNVFSDKTFNQKTERFFIIDEDYDLWLSFDFNIDPTTVVIAQKTDIGLLIHDCIQVKGGTEVLCNHLNTLGYNYNNFRLKVTGDTSGHSGSSSSGSVNGVYNTDYSIITKVLGVPKPLIVHNKGVNEQYTLSRRTINVSFEQLPIFIHERCEILINDLATAQVMNNATNRDKLLKDRENHKQDAGDAFRYFIHALFLGKEKGHKSIMQYAMELNKEYNEQ